MIAPPEDRNSDFDIHALEGIYLLYWKIEECAETVTLDTPLAKLERHMLVCLEVPRRMGDLGREMLALPSTVTAMADALEAKGLLTRERDPSDRRAWLLSLTAEGHELRRILANKAGDVFREISGLSETDFSQFLEIALKIRSKIMESGLPKGPQE
ncbi:MarR family transcriptional regulator [uncultured Pelagimonas sp.]|uniref:MarR family winged helix-turn-helix transcriptional regulator n=1 Tax=uncultured Pelagimonas sp. TaxID=1618102 RepID=UPI002620675C|nr:MarR family transcriptional regulator [uncultured Pelagimonas sp.]